jgi:hypothetical protein
VTEDSFDDVRHQSRFRRIELLHSRAVRTNPVCAVDAGIYKVNRNAVLIDQVALSSAALWIHALPDTVRFRIQSGLYPLHLCRVSNLICWCPQFSGCSNRHVNGVRVVQK